MHPLELLARDAPDRMALRAGEDIWSYQRMYHEASSIATELHERFQLTKGMRVATLAGNTAKHVVTLHALMLLGITCVPLNTRLPSSVLNTQLDLLRPALLLTEQRSDFLFSGAVLSLSEINGVKENAYLRPAEITEQNILSIIFTSGSTALPKAVPHTWTQHYASAYGSRVNLGSTTDDAWLCPIPLCHIGGFAIVIRCLLYGCAMVLPADTESKTINQELRGRVTLASLVPTQLHRIFQEDPDLNDSHCPQLRTILLGGAAAHISLWEEIKKRGLPILGTYGMTESCSQVCTAPLDRATEFYETAGLPVSGATLRIVDVNGVVNQPCGQGEIQLKGAMLMSGYLDNPEANAACFDDGWFRTGDIGVQDERGALRVLGRLDEMIISGGENIHPSEIEAELLLHPQVRDVMVVGLDNAEWGQELAAMVVADNITEKELIEWCRDRLGALKTPKRWAFVEDFPRTASGKALKAEAKKYF